MVRPFYIPTGEAPDTFVIEPPPFTPNTPFASICTESTAACVLISRTARGTDSVIEEHLRDCHTDS